MSAEPSGRLWMMRAAFAGLMLLILFVLILPVETSVPGRWAGMDLIMCFAMAWAVRRPEFVPVGLLAAMFLLADLLLQRPPGLWAVLLLLACERLKSQSPGLRDAGFPTEYITVATLIILIYVANRLALVVLLIDLPPLGLYFLQMIATLVVYPLAVFVTHVFLGVRKQSASDLGSGGIVQ